MSFGANVLVSDIPPHLELLEGLGFTFRAGDRDDLAEKLQHQLDHPELTAGMGAKLRERAVAAFSWKHVTRATEDVYTEMIGNR